MICSLPRMLALRQHRDIAATQCGELPDIDHAHWGGRTRVTLTSPDANISHFPSLFRLHPTVTSYSPLVLLLPVDPPYFADLGSSPTSTTTRECTCLENQPRAFQTPRLARSQVTAPIPSPAARPTSFSTASPPPESAIPAPVAKPSAAGSPPRSLSTAATPSPSTAPPTTAAL